MVVFTLTLLYVYSNSYIFSFYGTIKIVDTGIKKSDKNMPIAPFSCNLRMFMMLFTGYHKMSKNRYQCR